MSKKYCSIYSKLVKGEGDMVGHIAYSLYKTEKVQQINEYKDTNNVDVVPDEIIDAFTAGRDNKKSVEHYRGMAETLLQEFMGGSFDDMSEQVIKEVTNHLTQHVDNNLLPMLPPKESELKRFFNGCLQSIGGAVALSVLVWLFANVVGSFSLGNMKISYKGNEPIKQEQFIQSLTSDTISIQNN